MKRLLAILFTIISVVASAQIFNPVDWEFSQTQLSDTEIELQFKANIEDHWHLYSQNIEDDGPVPTEFTFTTESGFELIEGVTEGEPMEEFDPNFDMILKYFGHEAIFTQKIKVTSAEDFTFNGNVYFMVCDDAQCLPPEEVEFSFEIKGVDGGSDTVSAGNYSSETEEGKSMWGLFIIAFLSGFLALLTPCVFPMIPMTVSFFTKQSKTKPQGIANAIIYGLSIIVIYVALGVGVSAVFGADALNNMATNPFFNVGFFILLIVFAASFLGAFEIQLPASWTNKSVEAEGKGGLIGIFFMAFTLALVSFSCTGPIVGTLLVEAASGGFMGPIIGMLGFSLAIALPFALFAAFPGWLNSLPQSGGWLNSVKVVIGFLEIALAFKFLSNADLVMGTHYLERELFISIWIVIFALLTMYLLGKLKFSHDSDLPYLSVGRLSIAILTGTLTLYMIPGLWGAPLKLISAFPPPLEYSESPYGVGYTLGGESQEHEEGQHLGPQGVMAFHDYEQGLAHAKKIGKPVLIDFTGKACVNCRKMEQDVWSDPDIKIMLKNDVVLISLYVDDRTKLLKEDQYETTLAGRTKKVTTIGDKWMVFQANTYGTNSQPYYVLLNHEEEQLNENANYQDYGSVELFTDWLKRGIKEYNK
jgi:thiol:disulfide interchange protein DsbD